MREFFWTRCRCHEDEEPPWPGWVYYGGCIKGSIDDPVNLWRVTRWAKEGGETTLYPRVCPPTLAPLDKYHTVKGKERAMSLLNFQSKKENGTSLACVTSPVTVTPAVTPPAPAAKTKGAAWALQLLKS